MKVSLKKFGGLFPSDTQSAEILKPCDGAFDSPSAFVPAQHARVLCDVFRFAVVSVWRNHFNAFIGHRVVQCIAIIRFISDDAFGHLPGQHEVKKSLNQSRFVRRCRHGVHRDRKTSRIDQDHDFHAFFCFGASDSIATASRFTERSIDKAFIQTILASVFNDLACVAHNVLEHAADHPLLKAAVHCTLGPKFARKVFPFGAVVEHPEDTAHRVTLVGAGPTTQRILRSFGDTFTNPIKLFVSKCKHDGMVHNYC